MTTLYIAGPMTGLPEYNYPAFETAREELTAAGYTVLCPTDAEDHNPTPGTHQTWDWYMRHAIRMVTHADGIALLPGWHASRGATLEARIARQLALPVHHLDQWLHADHPAPADVYGGQPALPRFEGEDTFLVAFTVDGAPDRATAEHQLHDALGQIIHTRGITEWWVAEDDRRDGSDRDSAMFTHYLPHPDAAAEATA